jgi:hypothetical protein
MNIPAPKIVALHKGPHKQNCDFLLLVSFILTANGFLPGGSGTTIRHNSHITQNNKKIKRNTAHKTTHTINTLHAIHNNHNYN